MQKKVTTKRLIVAKVIAALSLLTLFVGLPIYVSYDHTVNYSTKVDCKVNNAITVFRKSQQRYDIYTSCGKYAVSEKTYYKIKIGETYDL